MHSVSSLFTFINVLLLHNWTRSCALNLKQNQKPADFFILKYLNWSNAVGVRSSVAYHLPAFPDDQWIWSAFNNAHHRTPFEGFHRWKNVSIIVMHRISLPTRWRWWGEKNYTLNWTHSYPVWNNGKTSNQQRSIFFLMLFIILMMPYAKHSINYSCHVCEISRQKAYSIGNSSLSRACVEKALTIQLF